MNLQKQINTNYFDIEQYNLLMINFPLFCNTYSHTPRADTARHYKSVINPLQMVVNGRKQRGKGQCTRSLSLSQLSSSTDCWYRANSRV